jgi:integrase
MTWLAMNMPGEYSGTPMKDLRGYLRPKQVAQILDLGGGSERDKLLVRVLWMTGARISEIVGLAKVDSVDGIDHRDLGLKPEMLLADENIIVLNTLKRTRKDKATGKRNYCPVERRVPVPSSLMVDLVEYVTDHDVKEGTRIFPIGRRTASKTINKMALRAGVRPPGRAKRVHPHHFRHSYCVACVKADNSIEGLRRLQARLNQASFSTTAHYLQFGATKKEAKKIEEIFR